MKNRFKEKKMESEKYNLDWFKLANVRTMTHVIKKIKHNLGLTMINQHKNKFNQNLNHPNHINHKKLVVSNEVYRIHHSSDMGRNKK
jgi:hypothetical protein